MKKTAHTIVATALLLCFASCHKDTIRPIHPQDPVGTTYVMQLKVDYLTHQFEGAHIDTISHFVNTADTIPLLREYYPPADFGWEKYYYVTPDSNHLLFSGGVIWMGCGQIEKPQYSPASNFLTTELWRPLPSSLTPPPLQDDGTIECIWESVQGLDIMNWFYAMGSRQPRFSLKLYTPSIGVGDPAEWDWILYVEADNTL